MIYVLIRRTLDSKHSCCPDQASFASKKTAMFVRCHVDCLELTNCRVLSRPITLVTLDARARRLPDYLLAFFHQSKRFYAENVKAKATRNEIR